MLASLAASGDTLSDSLKVAFCHLFFNISGILLWFPIPIMRNVPIKLAMFLGDITAKYRWFAIFYLFMMFFVAPAFVFGLSLAGWYVLLGVALPIVILLIIVIIINVMQNKCPTRLPNRMRTWLWLPLFMRSLEPLDRVFRTICFCCKCCQPPPLTEHKIEPEATTTDSDDIPIVISRELSRDGIGEKKHNAVQTPTNTDPEIGAQTNYAFEADENTTELKVPEVNIVTENETGTGKDSKPEESEPELKTIEETEVQRLYAAGTKPDVEGVAQDSG
jgi:hypothetical protein